MCFLADHVIGLHVWRHSSENRESEVLGITFPKLRVPTMARGCMVQPSPEEISLPIGRPDIAFAIGRVKDVVNPRR